MDGKKVTSPNTLTILNTRPSPMGEALQQHLALNFNSYHFPAIVNTPISLTVSLELKKQLQQWLADNTVGWIFISRTAALFFHRLIQECGLTEFIPAGGIFAIGDSTKSEIEHFTKSKANQIITPQLSNSESFLTLNELNSYQTFIHVKGQGGRALIADELTKKNKHYQPLDLYQRQLIEYSNTEIQQWQKCDLILATSIDIAQAVLTNLGKHIPTNELVLLLQKIKWVVLSQRIKQFLMDKMIKEEHIFICEQSDNSSIINTINLISK